MRALLVHHPGAGDGEHDRRQLLATLAAAGVDAIPCEVEPPVIRAALTDERFDLVAVAGGDGTAALAITLAAELRATGEQVTPIALLPIGGLNNIASAFGIVGEPAELAPRWQDSREVPIDVGMAQGAWGQSCFVEACGFGALSDGLSSITESPDDPTEKKAVGRAAFRDALIRADPVQATLSLDGERMERPLLMLEILNLPCIGPRLRLAPDADPTDARLDVLMVGPGDRAAMLDWLDADCTAPCPVATIAASEIAVERGFERCRLDDPKRERGTEGAPVTLAVMPQPVGLLLPVTTGERE